MEEIKKYNINTITNSFFKKGKIEELDNLKYDIDKSILYYNDICKTFSNCIDKNSNNFVKLDKTDKDGFFY